ncbi:MAG TPA: outer membrane beta-barrel protein [Gemmatimonadaceae bacterium]|jgi:opacity protein-like surface antigen
MIARVIRVYVAAAACVVAGAHGAFAQSDSSRAQLGLDRVGSYLSYTTVEHARNGWELGGDVDVGSVFTPKLHLLAEANYLHADLHRFEPGEIAIPGSFHDFSLGVAARYSVAHVDRFEPYVGAGIGVHFLGTDIARSQPIHDDYTGAKLGGEYFLGVSFDLTRRWALYGEVRRMEVPPASRVTYRLGFFVRL